MYFNVFSVTGLLLDTLCYQLQLTDRHPDISIWNLLMQFKVDDEFIVPSMMARDNKAGPKHDAATPAFHRWNKVFRLEYSVCFLPNIILVIQTKEFNCGLIFLAYFHGVEQTEEEQQ